ncbi:MAG: ATP-binding protein [Gemmatimonadales bacterium]
MAGGDFSADALTTTSHLRHRFRTAALGLGLALLPASLLAGPGFALLGIAIADRARHPRGARPVALGAAAVAFGFALATLHLGLTSVLLLPLAAAALLGEAPHTRDRHRWAERLAMGVFLVGVMSLVGHIYRVGGFRILGPRFGSLPAWPTAATLAAASGIVFLIPSAPGMRLVCSASIAGRETRRLLFLYVPAMLLIASLISGWEGGGGLSAGEAAAFRTVMFLLVMASFGWQAFQDLDLAEASLTRALTSGETNKAELQAQLMQRTSALTATSLRAEAARAQLQAVMESAPDLIAAIDSEHHYVVANRAYLAAFRDNRDRVQLGGAWQRALAGERFSTTNDIPSLDGPPVTYEMAFGPVKDGRGHVIGAVGLLRDVTARRALERQALESQEALRRSELDLAGRNQDLETLLHVISHDLKEPLRSIESFSRLLATRHAAQLDPKGVDFLERVVRATARLGQLLEEIQLLARARRAEPGAAQVEGREVVQEVLERLDGAIREVGATVDVEAEFPSLHVERVWATQALYNLVANALKFRRPGEPADIRVIAWERDGAAGFQVLDRGPGVPIEQSERIFQLFQRGVGREVPGTGAGLAIVRQIAERHGGRAWVEPRQGGGSVFTVTFAAERGRAA